MTAAQIWHGPEALRPALMPLDLLNLDPHNARAHSDRNIEAIGASLTAFGQMRPLVVQAETRTVVAGNGTLRAMRALGWTHAAATVAEISPATARAYAIADNRTAELAEWDAGELAAALNDSALDGLLDAVGFSTDEIDDLLRDMPDEPTNQALDQVGQAPAGDQAGDQADQVGQAAGAQSDDGDDVAPPNASVADAWSMICQPCRRRVAGAEYLTR